MTNALKPLTVRMAERNNSCTFVAMLFLIGWKRAEEGVCQFDIYDRL